MSFGLSHQPTPIHNLKALRQLQSAKLFERLRADLNESQSSAQARDLTELLSLGQNEVGQCEAEIARLSSLLSSVQRHRRGGNLPVKYVFVKIP